MSGGTSSMSNVLDLPHEILVKIILYLNPRERIVLAHSSKLLHSFVFGNEDSLKHLDFSNEGRLTTASDIKKYFQNHETSKHIQKVNLRNVTCINPEQVLERYINKALNLVDINIHGTELNDIYELRSFLEPLTHVKRLSIDWPRTASENTAAVLQRPFSPLQYLSVKIYSVSSFTSLTTLLELCQELKELHMVQEDSHDAEYDGLDYTFSKIVLRSLEVVEFSGNCPSRYQNYFISILPNPNDWTSFGPFDKNGFYFAKNVQVFNDLIECQISNERNHPMDHLHLGWYVHWEFLFSNVIRTIDRKRFLKNICCITPPGQCLLKVDEAKQLLKNPRHPITYLYISHNIDMECDAHLLAKAFPTLTELHLSNITRSRMSSERIPHYLRSRRCTRQSTYILLTKYKEYLQKDQICFPTCSSFSGNREAYDMGNIYIDSSFQILVEDTPRVTDVTLDAKTNWLEKDEAWDLEALEQIQRWRRLRSLRLLSVPIVNGDFLIEIGKECTRLEKLELYNLGTSDSCCYIKELALMLSHCNNLMDFSMKADNVGQVSGVLFSLAKNLKLKRVRLILTTSSEMDTTKNLISSVEELLRACPKLTTFVCIIDGISQAHSDQLTTVLRRLRDELNRPTLQFQVVRKSGSEVHSNVDTVCEDSFSPSFPYNLEKLNWQ